MKIEFEIISHKQILLHYPEGRKLSLYDGNGQVLLLLDFFLSPSEDHRSWMQYKAVEQRSLEDTVSIELSDIAG